MLRCFIRTDFFYLILPPRPNFQLLFVIHTSRNTDLAASEQTCQSTHPQIFVIKQENWKIIFNVKSIVPWNWKWFIQDENLVGICYRAVSINHPYSFPTFMNHEFITNEITIRESHLSTDYPWFIKLYILYINILLVQSSLHLCLAVRWRRLNFILSWTSVVREYENPRTCIMLFHEFKSCRIFTLDGILIKSKFKMSTFSHGGQLRRVHPANTQGPSPLRGRVLLLLQVKPI